MRRRRTSDETGATQNCAPVSPAARPCRHRLPGFPAALPSLALALILAAGTLNSVGGSEDDVAERESARTAPAARPPAGRQPLRRLLEDCSRTPVCDRLPRGWTRLLDPASGCDYYWNAFTQSSTWDAPVCIPQRPPVAPTVPGPAPPHPTLPEPVQTTAPSPAPTTRPRPRPRQTTTPLFVTTVPDPTPAPASTTQATTLGIATTVPSLITATPAPPASNASQNATLGAETAHEPLAMYRQLRPFVLGAVRLVGVDFHDFRADESQHLLVASAFVRALRGAGVDPSLSNGTLHMLGWCEDLRVTCERAPANTSFPAPSIPAGREGAGNGAPEPVANGDKADVTEIFLRLDLQGLVFELDDSTSVEGGGRVEQAGGGLRRGSRRLSRRAWANNDAWHAWANDDAWPAPPSLPMPPFQAPQVQGVYYRVQGFRGQVEAALEQMTLQHMSLQQTLHALARALHCIALHCTACSSKSSALYALARANATGSRGRAIFLEAS